MALFGFGKKDVLLRLKTRDWSSDNERDALIEEGIGTCRSQETLLDFLYSYDPRVRRAAMRRLRQVLTPAALDAFFKISRDKPPANVEAVAGALAQLLGDTAHDRAIKAIEHRDKAIRRAAEVFLMASPMNRKMMTLARQWLEDSDPGRARQVMEKIATSLQDPQSNSAELIALVYTGVDHPDEHVRQQGWKIITALRRPGDLSMFIDAIGRETYANQKLLANAITRLVRSGHANVAETILPLLGSTSAVLRSTAVTVLRQIDDPDKLISQFVETSRTMPPLVRERALETLSDMGERLIGPLLTLMESSDPETRMLAITLASSLGEDQRMLEPLLNTLNQKQEWWVQATAAETLGAMGAPEAITPLHSLLKDADTIWPAISALTSIADKLQKAGDTRQSTEALKPLLGLLKAGQRQGVTQVDDTNASDIRLEIIRSMRPMRDRRLIEVLRHIAGNDRSSKVREEALKAAEAMATARGESLKDAGDLRQAIAAQRRQDAPLKGVDEWLAQARARGASDLHIAAAQPVMLRIRGRLVAMDDPPAPLPSAQAAKLIRELVSDAQAAVIADKGQLNLAYTVEGVGRFRANIFSDYRGLNAVFRVIPEEMPTIASIGLPPHFADVQYWHQGLLLVCGASGSGKTTTLTALINLLNETRETHILTIEDPIEYVHTSRRSLVNQRELSLHTRSTARALRGALRQDPDIIVIGEMNDPETVALALEASETGHLVIGTLNSTRAPAAIDRVIGSFAQEEQNQIRLALSESLKGVIAQSLIPDAQGQDMAAVFEVLMGTPTVRNIIREGKNIMLDSVMQTGQTQGMQTFDDALGRLVRSGRVSMEDAARRAHNKAHFEDLLSDVEDNDAAPTPQARA